ncbi:M1 family aminopeptidase [Blastococcus sp. TF02A-30]|uniref:M1 family aminopeptidase n=1 Tax=Blastococcus sp. TF02A-30 TaxID=2250580 RepID=UPI000DE9FAC4|nr:M1 family aminopeptidase [Blastococcus sp. TF02A-30]RBY93096.1 peptidase M1 [Blastococcus sp. TF02A-30]
MTPRRRVAALAAGLLLLPGCTSFADRAAAPAATSTAAPAAGAPGDAGGCTDRAEPDPDRPVVDLEFRLEDDLRTVTGTETVEFTPDRPVEELVFRLVPNGPEPAAAGSRLVVDAVRGEDVDDAGYEALGAAEPGGQHVVRLDRRLAAGERTEVALDFTLTLGEGGFDRVGAEADVSWWASGAPLLAWEPGVGWAEDPFVEVSGETTTSPAADTTISVSAPQDLTVLMTGDQDPPSPAAGGRRTWTSAEPVARDVSVAVGRFTTEERTTPEGVRVTAGVLPGAERGAADLADATVTAIDELSGFLGPFPYRTLTVPLLPDHGGGIEYPSSILQATPSTSVLVHEVAHMWFYGMVGNSQFRDPWLDEAFATWAEAVVDPSSGDRLEAALDEVDGEVGSAMDEFTGQRDYVDRVYGKGGAALLRAREVAGADAFDAAVRCYVDATAWGIATPDDVADALDGLPAAADVLVGAGALPPG